VNQSVPEAFRAFVDLSADSLGTFVVYATDDYFAPKENLVRPDAPEWKEGLYTDRGKWMDGWESQRKRSEGHDFAILRLGVPGSISGLLCDTTHFKGNAPEAVSLEVCEASHLATADELLAAVWTEVLPRTPVKADFPNELTLTVPSPRATHVRLHIYPDGGVARLRLYGVADPAPRVFWQPASIDLAALEHGGGVAAVSDQFFGPPSNLLLPGRGVNMGDGWETKRRRTPGSDWCVIRLGRRGVVERIELDTHFFKGNAPQAVRVDALDATGMSQEELNAALSSGAGFAPFIEKTPVVQHRRHILEPSRPLPLTHFRVHIFPHGGVNRMRFMGYAVDTASERERLADLNEAPHAEAAEIFRSLCAAARWVDQLVDSRPFPSVREVFSRARASFFSLQESDYLQAFEAHPRLGATKRAAAATERSATWSTGEQREIQASLLGVETRLAELNEAYLQKFGFIFICFASGRTAPQILELLEERIGNSRAQELEQAAREQWRITQLRLEKWLLAGRP
jgi:allantoicase